MLADAGGHVEVGVLGEFVELFDDELGGDEGRVLVLVGHRGILFPLGDLGVPSGVALAAFLVAGLVEEEVKFGEGEFDVGLDGEADELIFINFGVVDVDVDDGAVLAEFFDFAGDAVVEADAEGEEEVGFVGGVIGGDGAVHAEPLEGEGVGFGEGADAHEGGGDGDLGALGEFEQFGVGFAADDAAAGVDDGALGLFEEAHGLVEGDFVDFGEELVAAEVDFVGVDGLGAAFLDVFGHVDDDGAGAAGLGDVEGFLDDAGDIVGVGDEVAVFDDGEGDAEEVGFLEGAAADHEGGDLAGDGDEGGGVEVGVGDGGDEVGGAGAGGAHADAGFAGGAGVAFGGEGAALFVAGEDGADEAAFAEGLVHGHGSAAGVGEDPFDAFFFEAFDEDFGAGHQFPALRGGGFGGFGGSGGDVGAHGKRRKAGGGDGILRTSKLSNDCFL